MYSKTLRQFSKGSVISVSSESSKIHLLSKVLYRPIWFKLFRRYLLFHALNVSLSFLDMKYFSFANIIIPVSGVTHILNLPTVCVKMMLSSRPTNPPITLHVKIQNPKIDFCNFRYKISVGILMKLFFLSYKWINK